MNKLFVLAVGLVAVGVLVGMGVLQTAPTPNSVKIYDDSGSGGFTNGWPATAAFMPSGSGNLTGVSLRLSLDLREDPDGQHHQTQNTGAFFQVVCAGQSRGTGGATFYLRSQDPPKWFTLPRSSAPQFVTAGESCSVTISVSNGDVSATKWSGTTADHALVVWATAPNIAPPPPTPGPPPVVPGVEEEAPPPSSSSDPTFLLIAVVLIVGGFALILIRR